MTRDIAIDMAREMARHVDAGKSGGHAVAAILQAFPAATAADMKRAMHIGLDQMEMWEEQWEEEASKAHLLFHGGSDAEIKAAFERTKLSAETLFPKPDKTRS
jgi:hypothetical protein